MKHIVQFSGGKDSTAMLLMMLEREMPIDYILFCDVGKEFPQMYEHIKKVNVYIKEHYNKEITFLKDDLGFDYWFSKRERIRGKNKGIKGYGWASMRVRWCTYLLKTNVTKNFLSALNEPYTEYIGIAYDEPKRHEIRAANVVHPLYDWHITEKEALEYCYNKGFDWNGLYEHFDRVSCYCCPLKRVNEYRVLYNDFPDLWQNLREMDKEAHNKFTPRYTVDELEKWFKYENDNNLPPQRIKRKILDRLP